MHRLLSGLFLASLVLVATGCAASTSLPPTAPSTPSSTLPPTPTFTPTITFTPTLTATITPTPIPAWYQPLDASYAVLKYGYALVEDANAEVYDTLEDAVSQTGNHGYLPFVPAYVAFYTKEERNSKTYYGLASGPWMDGDYLKEVATSQFTGLQVTRSVDFRFGWVLGALWSVNRAGTPLRPFERYQIVTEFKGVEPNPGYLAIGADEWLPRKGLALVTPQTPKGLDPCRFIYVSIQEQTLSVYDKCQLIFATLVSTGQEAWWTPAGHFSILYKPEDKYITLTQPNPALSDYYLQAVPYFMSYYGNLAFHGAYWHDDYGYPVSHGCVNLSPGDARWLYEWAGIGERVVVSPGE
jgi:lipoprotein-anchoring transpeptidase ErfK/SrfK